MASRAHGNVEPGGDERSRILPVDESRRAQFVAYALAHGAEHDDSYTTADDLVDFDPALEPAMLACDSGDRIVGAASLMLAGYRQEGLGRFRILHAAAEEAYVGLVEAILAAVPSDIRHVFLFLKEDSEAAGILARLGFAETRRACVLERTGGDVERAVLPVSVSARVADPIEDALAWAAVINAAFAGDPGRYDLTVEVARRMLEAPRVLPGGALLAWKGGQPVAAAVAGWETADSGESVGTIDTLAVVPAMQGAGLGRAMLRRALKAARGAGFDTVQLSTAVTNARALSLYLNEGFEAVQVAVCWGRDLSD